MKKIVTLLFTTFLAFAFIFTSAISADAKTLASSAKAYELNPKIYKKIYIKNSSDYGICDRKSSSLTFKKSRAPYNWECASNKVRYGYTHYSKNTLAFTLDGSDYAPINIKFPIKSGNGKVYNPYYQLGGPKYYKTNAHLLKKYKTKAGTFNNVIKYKERGYTHYLSKNRGALKITDPKGRTLFEITKFVKK